MWGNRKRVEARRKRKGVGCEGHFVDDDRLVGGRSFNDVGFVNNNFKFICRISYWPIVDINLGADATHAIEFGSEDVDFFMRGFDVVFE